MWAHVTEPSPRESGHHRSSYLSRSVFPPGVGVWRAPPDLPPRTSLAEGRPMSLRCGPSRPERPRLWAESALACGQKRMEPGGSRFPWEGQADPENPHPPATNHPPTGPSCPTTPQSARSEPEPFSSRNHFLTHRPPRVAPGKNRGWPVGPIPVLGAHFRRATSGTPGNPLYRTNQPPNCATGMPRQAIRNRQGVKSFIFIYLGDSLAKCMEPRRSARGWEKGMRVPYGGTLCRPPGGPGRRGKETPTLSVPDQPSRFFFDLTTLPPPPAWCSPLAGPLHSLLLPPACPQPRH